MKMKINSSINVQVNHRINQSVVAHISRAVDNKGKDGQNHITNPNIDLALSKYNILHSMWMKSSLGQQDGNTTFLTFEGAVHTFDIRQWGGKWRKALANARKQHNPTRIKRCRTLSHYLNSSAPKRKRVVRAVATLGHGARQRISKSILTRYSGSPKALHKRILKAYSSALAYYARRYNKRNHFTKLIAWGTNVDEVKDSEVKHNPNIMGSPHLHMAIYSLGHTPSGNPSANFGTALSNEFGKSGKRAMAAYHKQESKALLKSFQTVLNQRFPKCNFNFIYTKTNSKMKNLSMKQYKRIKTMGDKQLANINGNIKHQHERYTTMLSNAQRASSSYHYYRSKGKDLPKSYASASNSYSTELDSLKNSETAVRNNITDLKSVEYNHYQPEVKSLAIKDNDLDIEIDNHSSQVKSIFSSASSVATSSAQIKGDSICSRASSLAIKDSSSTIKSANEYADSKVQSGDDYYNFTIQPSVASANEYISRKKSNLSKSSSMASASNSAQASHNASVASSNAQVSRYNAACRKENNRSSNVIYWWLKHYKETISKWKTEAINSAEHDITQFWDNKEAKTKNFVSNIKTMLTHKIESGMEAKNQINNFHIDKPGDSSFKESKTHIDKSKAPKIKPIPKVNRKHHNHHRRMRPSDDFTME